MNIATNMKYNMIKSHIKPKQYQTNSKLQYHKTKQKLDIFKA